MRRVCLIDRKDLTADHSKALPGQFHDEVSFGPATGQGQPQVVSLRMSSESAVFQEARSKLLPPGSFVPDGPNDVLCFAIDMVNLKGWVRRNGGPWNGVTAADPVANIFGVDLSGMFTPTAPPYPSVGIGTGTNSTNFTANFGATAFAQTKPAGYGDATLQTYASAVDGETVHDGSAVFRAGCRFSQNVVLSTPQPQQPGYLYVYPHVAGRSDNKGSAVQTASIGYVLDPKINLT